MATQRDMTTEEQELYDICTRANVAIYKFFDLFTFELPDEKSGSQMATVRFGKTIEDDEVPRDVAKQLRHYIKEQKRAIRDNPRGYGAEEGRQKIFWVLTMLLQHGVFSPSYYNKVSTYAQFVFHESKEEE